MYLYFYTSYIYYLITVIYLHKHVIYTHSVRHSWQAASILLTSLSCIKKKNKSEYSEHSEHSSEYSSILLGDIELGTQDLLLWALAPVCVAVEMLSRLGSSQPGSAEFHLLPGVVRYCVRSISAADPEVVYIFIYICICIYVLCICIYRYLHVYIHYFVISHICMYMYISKLLCTNTIGYLLPPPTGAIAQKRYI
jgi:hypothetical protein